MKMYEIFYIYPLANVSSMRMQIPELGLLWHDNNRSIEVGINAGQPPKDFAGWI